MSVPRPTDGPPGVHPDSSDSRRVCKHNPRSPSSQRAWSVRQVATCPFRWGTPGGGVTFSHECLLCGSVPLHAGRLEVERHATEVPLGDLNRFTDRHSMRTDSITAAPVLLAPGSDVHTRKLLRVD